MVRDGFATSSVKVQNYFENFSETLHRLNGYRYKANIFKEYSFPPLDWKSLTIL